MTNLLSQEQRAHEENGDDGLRVRLDDPWFLFWVTLWGSAGLDEAEQLEAQRLVKADVYRLYADEAWNLLPKDAKIELAKRFHKTLAGDRGDTLIRPLMSRLLERFVAQVLAEKGAQGVDTLRERVLAAFDAEIEARVGRAVEAAVTAALREVKARLGT